MVDCVVWMIQVVLFVCMFCICLSVCLGFFFLCLCLCHFVSVCLFVSQRFFIYACSFIAQTNVDRKLSVAAAGVVIRTLKQL